MSSGLSLVERLQQFGAHDLCRDVARQHRVPLSELLGRSRSPRTVRARHAMWLTVKERLRLSYPETGNLFGVDHTSVLHAARKQKDGDL